MLCQSVPYFFQVKSFALFSNKCSKCGQFYKLQREKDAAMRAGEVALAIPICILIHDKLITPIMPATEQKLYRKLL